MELEKLKSLNKKLFKLDHSMLVHFENETSNNSKWAISFVETLSESEKLSIIYHYKLKGTSPLYAFFSNSQDWGNGGDTTYYETLALSKAKAKANRHADNWFAPMLENIAKKNGMTGKLQEVDRGEYITIGLVPNDNELASWIETQEELKDVREFIKFSIDIESSVCYLNNKKTGQKLIYQDQSEEITYSCWEFRGVFIK